MGFKIIVNGNEIEKTKGSTVKEIVRILNQDFSKKNEIILQILVDGKPYSFFNNEEQDIFLDAVELVEITTANSKDITIAGVMDSLTHIRELVSQLSEVVAKIQMGQEKEGMDIFILAVEGLRWFNAILLSVEGVLGFDLNEIYYAGQSFEFRRKELNEILNSIFSVFKMKDWVSLADTITYELVPHLEEWKNWMSTLMKIVQKKVQ